VKDHIGVLQGRFKSLTGSIHIFIFLFIHLLNKKKKGRGFSEGYCRIVNVTNHELNTIIIRLLLDVKNSHLGS